MNTADSGSSRMDQPISEEQLQQFRRDGFLIRRNLFSNSQIATMRKAVETDPMIRERMFSRTDADGNSTKTVQWNHPGESSYGRPARARGLVDTVETLLGGEVYHWHAKVTAKDARDGGAWEWHQDYGYWYHYGCLYPTMCSVMVALDNCAEENGCLRVLKGSHTVGRIDHIKDAGGQVNADAKRVAWVAQRHEEVLCELAPGDALFFHCNTLHSSGPNLSDQRRWAILYCYNLAANDPFEVSHNPRYTPLIKVDSASIGADPVIFADGTEAFQSTYVSES